MGSQKDRQTRRRPVLKHRLEEETLQFILCKEAHSVPPLWHYRAFRARSTQISINFFCLSPRRHNVDAVQRDSLFQEQGWIRRKIPNRNSQSTDNETPRLGNSVLQAHAQAPDCASETALGSSEAPRCPCKCCSTACCVLAALASANKRRRK
jgi:hypothetical protein